MDPVEAFLKRKTFACQYLCARLTPDECVERQNRVVQIKSFGRKLTFNDFPQDRHCRSGKCEQGREQKTKLRLKKKREREARREARLAATAANGG